MEYIKKRGQLIFQFLILFIVISGAHAQTESSESVSDGGGFPNTNYWSLSGGVGMTDLVVDGFSFQLILEPKLSVTPASIVGAKFGFSYSVEDDERNILVFETQAFYRWNFLRFGNSENTTNFFIQGGIGLVAAYRGNIDEPGDLFSDVTMTRGSLMADAALGITIPLSERWYIEPQVRGGYPHLWGVSVTAGYKFPVRYRTERETVTVIEYRERTAREIIERIQITAVEYIIFGPNSTVFNENIDSDAVALNTLVIEHLIKLLKDNPNYKVRMEGHANPIDVADLDEAELERVSIERVNEVKRLLLEGGAAEEQVVSAAYGGERVARSDTEHRNMNRRVEMIVVHIDTDF